MAKDDRKILHVMTLSVDASHAQAERFDRALPITALALEVEDAYLISTDYVAPNRTKSVRWGAEGARRAK